MGRLAAAMLLLAAAAMLWCPVADAQEVDSPRRTGARYAWTTIFYEAGHNDEEYFLGARVLMESIRQSGTEADRVVLVGPGTSKRFLNGFRRDGCITSLIENVPSPWGSRTPRRFLFSLNKLAVWTMTSYERVIYLDADVIVLQQADFLFKCGHFCAVFMNPIHFHTAVLVVKPSEQTYQDMLSKLKTLGSFDGADQGFFNAYFKGLSASSEWTSDQSPSNDAMNRLPIQYNMNHIYYYEKMRWGGVWGDASQIVTLTYPIMPVAKPWYWYWYPLLDMHWWWHRYRMGFDSAGNYPREIALLVLAPLLDKLLAHGERRLVRRGSLSAQVSDSQPGTGTITDAQLSAAGLWCVWGRGHCTATAAGFGLHFLGVLIALQLVPGITPPLLAWPVFLAYHGLFLSHSAQWLWLRTCGHRLRYERRVYVLYALSWALYLILGALPIYPHGLVKLCIAVVLTPLVCIGLLTSMFKGVYDLNTKLLASPVPHHDV